MGRLRTVATLLILGAWGAATEGSPPDDATAPPSAARPPSPVPPIKYLEAGAKLYNNGQYPLAAKYLAAAQLYRDHLTVSEQTVLDAYLGESAKAQQDGAAPAAGANATEAAAAAPVAAPAPVMAPAPGVSEVPPAAAPEAAPVVVASEVPPATAPAVPPAEMSPADPASPGQSPSPTQIMAASAVDQKPGVAAGRVETIDTKQKARWMLQAAREQIRQGNYDEAAKAVEQVKRMNVHWGLFDDTPAKVTADLDKARPKATVASSANQPHDRKAAKAKLKEARTALASNQFEAAEAIALDVKSWNLNYGWIEDSPDKVAAAARALRRRDQLRHRGPREQPSQGVYDILVQESRQLMSLGQWDQAEAKALQAQRMNVVPSLTADRADTVLHEIAMFRARQASPGAPADSATALAAATGVTPSGAQAPTQPGQAQMPPAEPASAVAEREANDLLARGDSVAASARFTQAERLRAQEQRPASGEATNPATNVAVVAPMASADPSIQKVDGDAAVSLEPLNAPPVNPATAAPTPACRRAPAPAPAPAPAGTGRHRQPDAASSSWPRPGRSTSAATTPVPARWRWRRRRASRASMDRSTSCSRRLHLPNKAVRSVSMSRPSTPSARAIRVAPAPSCPRSPPRVPRSTRERCRRFRTC